MRLSEHDVDQIESVARFCSRSGSQRHLEWVFLQDGWAIGTDGYRFDMREIDHSGIAVVNPVTLERASAAAPELDLGKMLRGVRFRGQVRAVPLDVRGMLDHLAENPRRKGPALTVVCLRCHVVSDAEVCGCSAPLVAHDLLAEALTAADELSVRVRFDRYQLAARYEEDGHHHLLMTVRRRPR